MYLNINFEKYLLLASRHTIYLVIKTTEIKIYAYEIYW